MNRDVCGICWALYDDEGRCECPQVQEPPRRTGLPHCERSCEADAFKIEIRRLTGEVRMLQEQNTELDRKLAELSERTLTDEIIADLWHQNGGFHHHFARAIERWLRGQK